MSSQRPDSGPFTTFSPPKLSVELEVDYEIAEHAPSSSGSSPTLPSPVSESQSSGSGAHIQKKIKISPLSHQSTCAAAHHDQFSTYPSTGATQTDTNLVSTPVLSYDPQTHKLEVKPTYIRHPRFTAPDGNILLAIGITRFRVHQSRLSYHSPWFRKLFEKRYGKTLNTDDEDEDDLNDVKVEVVEVDDHRGLRTMDLYHLNSTGIQLKDFEILLTALEDCIDFCHQKPSFSTVASILHSSAILKFPRFHRFTKIYLETEFSNALEDITEDRRKIKHAAEAIVLGSRCLGDDGSAGWTGESRITPLLNEGHEEGSNTHRDNRSPSTQIHHIVTDGDEEAEEAVSGLLSPYSHSRPLHSTELRDPALSDADEDEDPKGLSIYSLHPRDLVLLLNAQKRLSAFWISTLSLPPLLCPNTSSPCASNRSAKNWLILYGSPSENNQGPDGDVNYSMEPIAQRYVLDPICGLNNLIEEVDWRKNDYCRPCASIRVQRLVEKREELWESLDSWFGLEKEE
ncbi:hypothetical protein AX16_007061 [Volvariella volvacea WC 439]|nr:hypothetical protein AX16_007061 [Volvariella volvacea WC 439]